MHQGGRRLMSTSIQFETNGQALPARRDQGADRLPRLAVLLAAVLTVGAPVRDANAQAKNAPQTLQSADDPRWYPWVGCWQRAGESGASASLTCLRPSTGATAEILTIV